MPYLSSWCIIIHRNQAPPTSPFTTTYLLPTALVLFPRLFAQLPPVTHIEHIHTHIPMHPPKHNFVLSVFYLFVIVDGRCILEITRGITPVLVLWPKAPPLQFGQGTPQLSLQFSLSICGGSSCSASWGLLTGNNPCHRPHTCDLSRPGAFLPHGSFCPACYGIAGDNTDMSASVV